MEEKLVKKERVLGKRVKRAAALLGAVMLCGAWAGCTTGEQNGWNSPWTVYMPDGAPALALAKLMKEDSDKDEFEYRVVDPKVIAAQVTNKDASKNADFCVLPLTAASKLLGTGEKYQMLGTVTNGNLYVISKKAELAQLGQTVETDGNLSALVGKTVGVMMINEVPGMTFKSILEGFETPWQVLENGGQAATDKVNLVAIADATGIDPLSEIDCYVVAEPAASVQVTKNGFSSVADVQKLYDVACAEENDDGFSGFPQAVVVVKKDLADKKIVQSFMTSLDESAEWLNTSAATGEIVVSAVTSHLADSAYTTTLKAPLLKADVLKRCGVDFRNNTVCKNAVNGYLDRVRKINESSAKQVADSFFYFSK